MKKLFLILVISILFVPNISTARETLYLFNSEGEWVAFREGKYVFNVEAEWIGWNDADVADRDGKYLGTVTHGNRLYYFSNHPYRGNPGHPAYPGRPGYPGHTGYDSLPSDAKNAKIKK